MTDTAHSKSRPLSPHIFIYRPQITSVLSILSRITGGIVIVFGFPVLVWWLASAAAGPEEYAAFRACATSWLGQLYLFGITACAYYHLCAGVRHLFWDVGLGFELETVTKSGIAVVIATGVLTAITWLAVLGIL